MQSVITRSTRAPHPNERIAKWAARSALAGTYPRSPRPYPTFGVVRPPLSPPEGGDSTSSDYVPEMADCTGW